MGNTVSGITATKNVLVAVDNSSHSLNAFNWFIDNTPNVEKQNIILFHNLTLRNAIFGGLDDNNDNIYKTYEKDVNNIREKAEKLESEFLSICKTRNLSCEWVSQWGEPSTGIVRAVERFHCNFVVMGTCGASILAHKILGSVSNYVLNHVNIPVIIVPKRCFK